MDLNGNWYYGLVTHIQTPKAGYEMGWYISNKVGMPCAYNIRPETITQFLGLKDKNSKEIYEGDIVDFGGLKPIEIVWRNIGFETRLIPYENSYPITLTKEGTEMFATVIGNIYENPKLLK